ncbi:hypothetical protein HDV02_000092 [Globomyces sp. JEL0801]|nr:hypothetical protein HDV02_000092 [Globomyces sp. JEL0801]
MCQLLSTPPMDLDAKLTQETKPKPSLPSHKYLQSPAYTYLLSPKHSFPISPCSTHSTPAYPYAISPAASYSASPAGSYPIYTANPYHASPSYSVSAFSTGEQYQPQSSNNSINFSLYANSKFHNESLDDVLGDVLDEGNVEDYNEAFLVEDMNNTFFFSDTVTITVPDSASSLPHTNRSELSNFNSPSQYSNSELSQMFGPIDCQSQPSPPYSQYQPSPPCYQMHTAYPKAHPSPLYSQFLAPSYPMQSLHHLSVTDLPPIQLSPSPVDQQPEQEKLPVPDTTSETKNPIPVKRQQVGEKLYKCTYEGSYTRAYTLKLHVTAAHQKLKPYKCEYGECEHEFSRKHDLIRHTMIHNDERRYGCSGCSKRFRRKDHLSIHMRGSRCVGKKKHEFVNGGDN